MIDPDHPRLSFVRQCTLVALSRSTYYYAGRGESSFNRQLMRCLDQQFLATPWYGSRQMVRHLRRQGHKVGRKRVRRLMRQMGLTAIYRKPQMSSPDGSHRVYPYRLGHLRIERPNQVWCADITYIPMRRGFLYLVAIMELGDAHGAFVAAVQHLGLDSGFCREALQKALAGYGRPEIFNTDQGSQFTSREFTELLEGAGVEISMDGKGRWRDNVFIERLWRSLKYECIYLHDLEDGRQARRLIADWFRYYNQERLHSSLPEDRTPMETYTGRLRAA